MIAIVFCVVFFVLFLFVVYLVYPMLPVSLDCQFLIAPSVFSNVDIERGIHVSTMLQYTFLSLVLIF
jgi:hypothetical protein